MKPIITLSVVLLLALVACGTDDPETAAVPTTGAPTGGDLPLADDAGATFPSGMGPGISVEDLLATDLDGPLLVNAYVFVLADQTMVMSDAIAESFPPQPAGPQVAVAGVDPLHLPLTEGPDDVEIAVTGWTDFPVQLLGEMVDGVFVGTSVAAA
jgi:hypothetical protein